MSAVTVKENIFCGYLGIEAKENSGVFDKKFFRLDPEKCQLQYYSEKQTVRCFALFVMLSIVLFLAFGFIA